MASAPTDLNDIAALQRRIAELEAAQANLTGAGAIAQVGGVAVGAAGVKTADNSGTIITGTQIVTHYHAAAGGALPKEQIARQVAGYLSWLRARTQCIELRGIERAGGAPVVLLPLETAYVPLRARSLPRVGAALPHQGGNERGRSGRPDGTAAAERDSDITLNQVLGLGRRLVIIGGPGSGKTTVLLHMAWALASSLLTGTPEPACSRLGLSSDPSALPLPIVVPLASFARYRRQLPGQAQAREQTLAHFISHHLISRQADFDLPADFFVQLLQDGRDVLLLLDGLDEVANEDERAEVRQSVEDLVGGRAAMRVLVTCRTIAYRGGRTALGADFREIVVQPLDFTQHIVPMVQQAYACIHPRDKSLQAERVTDLVDGMTRLEAGRRARQGEAVPALVDSPLMVRLLLIVHVNNRRLPDERADLFDKAINALLQVDYGREEGDIRELSTDWKLFRDMAQHLAFHLHQQGRDQVRELEEPALKAALRQEADFTQPRIDDFLRHARQRGSVLEERNGVYRFIHLAFQEFLAARYLGEVTGRDSREAILAFLTDRLEWEKAARGGLIDAVFSWGDTPDPNAANYDDAQIQDTSAVGCFPTNGFGLHDMIGNVWEWTRSRWGTDWEKPDFAYSYRADDARREALDAGNEVLRVVRGGSWYGHRVRARCACRNGDRPDSRHGYLGFRVVLRAAPVSSTLDSDHSAL
jgi:hypothetical protein